MNLILTTVAATLISATAFAQEGGVGHGAGDESGCSTAKARAVASRVIAVLAEVNGNYPALGEVTARPSETNFVFSAAFDAGLHVPNVTVTVEKRDCHVVAVEFSDSEG